MKKFILGLVFCCSIGFGANVVYADEVVNTVDSGMDMTLGEIENVLMTYLKERGLNYSLHSKELSDYLYDQLTSSSDQELTKLDEYDNILAYAAEYIYLETLPAEDGGASTIEESSDMTLADVKEIVDEENLEASQKVSEQENSVPRISPRGVWSNNHVSNYARTFGTRPNPAYNNYDGRGGDCTNFASQALRAGGAKDGVTGYPGYIDWSSKRTSQGLKDSAAWINADAFRQYWQVKGRSVRRYSNRNDVNKNAQLGDILNYANKKTGRSWHNAVVTDKLNGNIYISQHSTNRTNWNWNSISLSLNDNYVYIIRAI